MTEKELLEDYLEMERANCAAFSYNGGKNPRRGLEIQLADAQERVKLLKKMIRRMEEPAG